MSVFTPAEIAYLTSQRVGRLATVSAAGDPHVVPLGYYYNPALDVIDIPGWGMGRSKKLRDVARTGRVAFVVDDSPGHPRGIEVRGRAEALPTGGQDYRPNADPQMIRLHPAYIATWGIEGDPYRPIGRAVE